ncbi:MAG: wax ester/triacylglycerol synthase family O-acyltransferase [Burkholderiaceae bacterium]
MVTRTATARSRTVPPRPDAALPEAAPALPAQEMPAREAPNREALASERMTKVDTAWLRMDCPSNLMMIMGVWIITPGIAHADLCTRVQERLLKYRRFSQRVTEDAAGANWVDDTDFDIERHVVLETLAPATRRRKLPTAAPATPLQALQQRIAELSMQPLPRSRPLWQMHLIEDFTDAHGNPASALIVRIHHCIADGIALISVTMSLVDGGIDPPARRRKAAPEGTQDWIADTLVKPFTSLSVKALGMAGDSAARSLQMLQDPQKSLNSGLSYGMSQSLDMAKLAYQVISDAAALALMPDDSPTRLKGKPGNAKRVAWCEPIPLAEVKAVSKALGCSINDVLLSCVAGAIGDYLKSYGDNTDGQEIRAMVPVNLRPLDQAYKLGNRFGLAPLVLPIGIANPIARVYEVRRRMNSLKGSTQPLLAFGLLAVAGLLIKPAQDAMLNLFGRKATAVMTNVPGPQAKLKICGATVQQTMFWVPQSGDIGLGVSILSYGGGVQFGVITDSTLCPDPQHIIDAFEPQFTQLAWLTLMMPWGD